MSEWLDSPHGFHVRHNKGLFIVFEKDAERIKEFVQALTAHLREEVSRQKKSILAILFIRDRSTRDEIDRNPSIIDFRKFPI